MITFSNGRLYKLVYIDTNIINEISKNTNKLGKNFFLKYVNGEYMFVTSAFNVYELSKSKGESKNKIIQIFNNIPLGITCTFPQLIEFEKLHTGFHKDMVMFATGPKGIFNNQLENIFYIMQNDKSFGEAQNKMIHNFNSEIACWCKNQRQFNWQKDYKMNILKSMNETFKIYDNYFEIKELGKYYSLEVLAYIKNQFIFCSQKDININSVIDAYNSSFLPYVEEYITERTVGSWLEMSKAKLSFLKNKRIIKLSELYEKGKCNIG